MSSVVGKLYGRVLIERVRAGTDQGRRCMDKVFAKRQGCEKYLANVFWAFMDLEKAYYMIDQHDMWQMLRVCAVVEKLLKTVQSFFYIRELGMCLDGKWCE